MSKTQWKNIRKIGLGIVAFEGSEHLANIITELRDVVDYVSIGLQRESYHGSPIDLVDLSEIFRLRDEDKLVDNIVEIKLDTSKEPRVQETDKRNMLIQDAEDHGCSHVIIIDSDEFYNKHAFIRALQEIDANDYEVTYCQYVNYYHDYRHFMVYPFEQGMYVPFVSKTKYRHIFECQDFPFPSDPTRRFVLPYDRIDTIMHNGRPVHRKHYTVEPHIFPWKIVKMHHLSWLRADIRKKVNVWSSKLCFENYDDLIDKAVDVYNNFNETSTDQQVASLLFNTPNHEVYVRAFPKQYIRPAFDFNTRLRPVKKYKRIAIMNLSTTNSSVQLFEKLEQCCKDTWAKDVVDGKYDNIEYWTVIDAAETSIDEETHTIYVKTNYNIDNTQQLLSRWLIAYSVLSKSHSYDYVLRTNTSTWCNIDIINEFLANETDDSLVYTNRFNSAFWSTFNVYCSGAAMIWSTRNITILQKLVNETDQKTLDLALDDVMMSALWRKRAQKLKLSDVNKIWHSMCGGNLPYKYDATNWDEVDICNPFYQIKTGFNDDGVFQTTHQYRLQNDIEKMKKLYQLWIEKKDSLDIPQIANNIRTSGLDKVMNVLLLSKPEFFASKNPNKYASIITNELPYNQQTLDFLESHAKKCGYKH